MTLAVQVGTQHLFSGGSLTITDSGNDLRSGSPVNTAITLTSLGNGAGRQSAKFSFPADRAPSYNVMASIELAGTPTAGGTIDFYWAPSNSGTAGSGNVASLSGTDASATDGAPGTMTVDEVIAQCDYIGSLTTTDDVAVHTGFVGVFSPSSQHGMLIVVNNSGNALAADANEHHVVFEGISFADV